MSGGNPAQFAASFLSAVAQSAEGRAIKAQKDSEAEQATDLANAAKASGQRAAVEEKRRGDYIASEALASAAASGGGASDPTVVGIISDIHGESEYRALVRMYEGNEEARGLKLRGKFAKFEGSNAEAQGNIRALSTVIGGADKAGVFKGTNPSDPGGGGMYGKYGQGGPWADSYDDTSSKQSVRGYA